MAACPPAYSTLNHVRVVLVRREILSTTRHTGDGIPPSPPPALFNPVGSKCLLKILSNIFPYLRTTDLLNCRGVCKEWNDEVLDHFVLNNLVKMDFKNVNEAIPNEVNGIGKYASVMESSRRIPVSKYVLRSLPRRYFVDRDFLQLFRVCGTTMKYLELEIPNSLPTETFVQAVRDLSQLAPNLVSVHLINFFCSVPAASFQTEHLGRVNIVNAAWTFSKLTEIAFTQNNEPVGPDLVAWKALFQSTPNLRKVSMIFKFRDHRRNVEEVIEALSLSNRMANLTKMRLSGISGRAIFILTTKAVSQRMSLLEFSATEVDIFSDQVLSQFLETQQKSLIMLELGKNNINRSPFSGTCIKDRYNTQLKLKTMEKLTTIKMQMGIDGILFKTENSWTDLPKLKTVAITGVVPDMAELMSRTFSCHTVAILSVCLQKHTSLDEERQLAYPNSPSVLISLGKMFPMVKHLTLTYPSVDHIVDIEAAWPQLEHLKLNLRTSDYAQRFDFARFSEIRRLFPSFRDRTKLRGLKTLAVDEHREDKPDWVQNRLFVHFPSDQDGWIDDFWM